MTKNFCLPNYAHFVFFECLTHSSYGYSICSYKEMSQILWENEFKGKFVLFKNYSVVFHNVHFFLNFLKVCDV